MIDPQLLAASEVTTEMAPKSAAPISTTSAEMTSKEDLDEDESENVDLSEEESESARYLIDLVTGTSQDPELPINDTPETEQEDLLNVVEETQRAQTEANPVHCSGEQFVANFAKINVFRNAVAAKLGKQKLKEDAGNYVATGNSRDDPSLFMLFCPNEPWGCDYKHGNSFKMNSHARKCKISEANPVTLVFEFKCRKLNCKEEFKDVNIRNKHERDHDFVERTCNLGCDDGTVYKTESAWGTHKARKHGTDWDTTLLCPLAPDDCPRKTGFPNRVACQTHLRETHKLGRADVKKHLPELKYREPVWGKRLCPFPDCRRAAPGKEIGRKTEMEAHLKTKAGGHQCNPEKIQELIKEILENKSAAPI